MQGLTQLGGGGGAGSGTQLHLASRGAAEVIAGCQDSSVSTASTTGEKFVSSENSIASSLD